MTNTVISVEHLTKRYNLGVIGTGTLARDLNKWWARWRGQPDPYTKIGQQDHNNRQGESILALDDVSFTVQQGEALGIIGANGAGKSTLLKILSRVTAPTSGLVKVRGRVGSLLEVGTGFHPELTGRENIYLNGAILGMRKEEVDRKFDEIVDFSGVEQFIDTPVKRYSSGMYVRLAFAVAAHLDPEILIVDEVLAVGDAEFQKKCLGKMDDVAGKGRTVLFVSHNMQAIQNLCKRAIVLEKGDKSFDGFVQDATSYYLKSNMKNKSEIRWSEFNAPANKDVRLMSICVKNNSKTENNNIITIDDQITICIEFYKLIRGENNFDLHIHLQNENGVRVFTTNSGWKKKHYLNHGPYSAECIIPPNLLNTGLYTISTLRFVTESKGNIFEYRDLLTFNLQSASDKKNGYFGKTSGVLRPIFKWKIKPTVTNVDR